MQVDACCRSQNEEKKIQAERIAGREKGWNNNRIVPSAATLKVGQCTRDKINMRAPFHPCSSKTDATDTETNL